MPISNESKRQRLTKLTTQLKGVRQSFDPQFRELGDHYAPRRTRFFAQDKNRGDKRFGKLINECGLLSARTLRSGMFAGITSPARPWRRITTPDPDLAEFGRVKDWLQHVNKNMTTLDNRTNLYKSLPTVYGDLGVFATGCMYHEDDDDEGYRTYTYPIGSYWLGANDRNVIDTFVREYSMTVRQIVTKFGDPEAPEARKWANFSQTVKNAFEKGNYEDEILVTHVHYPNVDYRPEMLDRKFKRFASCYYETATNNNGRDGDLFLRESGTDRFRVLVPRWDQADDVWGTSCPGMEVLGTVKEIQFLEKKKSKAIEKQLNPALKGPPSLRNQRVSLIAGDITLVDERDGKSGLSPIHEVNMQIGDVNEDIDRKERRVSRGFYEDLFLMLAQMEGIQPRGEAEIAERHEEKLIALGPVLECVNDDLLDPLTDLTFERMVQLGMVPEPPEEVQGRPLKIEYESILAKAQKLVGVAGTERFFGFTGNLLAAFPIVKHKIKPFKAIDEYGDMMGVSSNIIATDEEAQESLAAEQEALQKQQAAAAIPDMAKAAQSLSGADLSTDNALSRLLAGA